MEVSIIIQLGWILLLITVVVGDIVRFSDLNTAGKGFKYRVLKILLLYIYFSFLFIPVMLFLKYCDHIFYNIIILVVSIFIWYLNCKRYKVIKYKNTIIDNIYDKN